MTTELERALAWAVALIADSNPEFTRAQCVEIAMRLPLLQQLYDADRITNGRRESSPTIDSGNTGGRGPRYG